MATLTIRRQKSVWGDRVRDFVVQVDGEARGKVANGGSVTIELAPDMHQVRMAIDWCGSREVEVDGDHDTVLHCASDVKPLLALLYITLWRNDYIRLWRPDPRAV